MKNLFVLAMAICFAAPALATSLHPDTFTRFSKVTKTELDKKITKSRIVRGTINYDLTKKTVGFTLFKAGTCGFAGCDNLKLEVELQIKKVEQGNCGLHIEAEQDRRQRNGLKQSLKLTDMSVPRLCKIMVPADEQIKVDYQTQGFSETTGITIKTNSLIYGAKPTVGRP